MTKRRPRTVRQRLDELLVDPSAPRGEWSSTRAFLFAVLMVFLALSILDPVFRDAGAFVSIVLAFLTAVVIPKALDLRVAIGQAASAIGRKFTRLEETTETTEGAEPLEDELEPDDPTPRRKPRRGDPAPEANR